MKVKSFSTKDENAFDREKKDGFFCPIVAAA